MFESLLLLFQGHVAGYMQPYESPLSSAAVAAATSASSTPSPTNDTQAQGFFLYGHIIDTLVKTEFYPT